MRITGISPDIYSGWSLLATATGLPREQSLEIREPFLLEPDARGQKRMIVTGAAEITDPGDNPRRFLLKAFAIDAEEKAPDCAAASSRCAPHRQCESAGNPAERQPVFYRDDAMPVARLRRSRSGAVPIGLLFAPSMYLKVPSGCLPVLR